MDRTLFFAINRGMENSFLDFIMPLITSYNTWIPVGIILFGYLIWENPKRGLFIFFVVLLAVALSDLINHRILKAMFARVRPCNALPDVHLLTGCSGSFSFPSSHAVNSFCLASTLWFFERKLLLFGVVAASLVAFSRVYVGVHYPFDVTVGALTGIAIGYAAYRIGDPVAQKWAPKK
ncbi:MAG: phosphatase PAP2 family protein [Nitrospinota bacterium]|nr:phosphatase PAP2 family protein [Nitrospinota bacterium]